MAEKDKLIEKDMKKKSQKKQKVDRCNILKNNKDGFMDETKPVYTSEELFYLIARFEQYAEAKRWLPEFFGDKRGEFIIID